MELFCRATVRARGLGGPARTPHEKSLPWHSVVAPTPVALWSDQQEYFVGQPRPGRPRPRARSAHPRRAPSWRCPRASPINPIQIPVPTSWRSSKLSMHHWTRAVTLSPRTVPDSYQSCACSGSSRNSRSYFRAPMSPRPLSRLRSSHRLGPSPSRTPFSIFLYPYPLGEGS